MLFANPNAIIDNNWHHIAATWDGTTSANGKKLYIDGVLVAQRTSAIASMGNPAYNFRIGIDYSFRPAKANIDEVKVYNRALWPRKFLRITMIVSQYKYPIRKKYYLNGPLLRKGASVAANVTLLPDIEIGESAMVADALVPKDVTPWKLAIGFPAEIKELPKELKTLNNI